MKPWVEPTGRGYRVFVWCWNHGWYVNDHGYPLLGKAIRRFGDRFWPPMPGHRDAFLRGFVRGGLLTWAGTFVGVLVYLVAFR